MKLHGIIPPVVTWFRLRHSRSLDDVSADIPRDPPLVSVVVPARDEAHNIERCVASILAPTYPRVELVVVEANSTDNTATVARSAAYCDSRLREYTSLGHVGHARLPTALQSGGITHMRSPFEHGPLCERWRRAAQRLRFQPPRCDGPPAPRCSRR